MTTELATRGATALDAVREAMAENLGGQFRPSDLERVKVPAGGGRVWSVPGLDGEEDVRDLVGVIVGHDLRLKTYWATAFEQRDASNPNPDCYSLDGVTGGGTPGGDCASCPLNQWGSGRGGTGKACGDHGDIYLLRDGDALPIVVSVPRTSLANVNKYLLRLAAKGALYWSAITKLTLEKVQNAGGIDYGRIVLSYVGRLDGEELETARGYATMLKQSRGSQG